MVCHREAGENPSGIFSLPVCQRSRPETLRFLAFTLSFNLPYLVFFVLIPANVSSSESSSGDTVSPPTLPVPPIENADELASVPASDEDEGEGRDDVKAPPSSLTSSSASSFLSLETLSCESFFDPGSSTIPFAYPPKKKGDQISCP